MTHNFRPGVMEKIGLDYNSVAQINPKIVYGEVTGYGDNGPWAKKPGQDLLVQSLSGLTYLSGNKKDNPTPMGIAGVDMFTGAHLAQGILAVLLQSIRSGEGGKVSVSLLESAIDLQFEVITTYLNNGQQVRERAMKGNAHAYLAAPYGVYKTKNGHIALAMIPLDQLAAQLEVELPHEFQSPESWFDRRDDIMDFLSSIFINKNSVFWLDKLELSDAWVRRSIALRTDS